MKNLPSGPDFAGFNRVGSPDGSRLVFLWFAGSFPFALGQKLLHESRQAVNRRLQGVDPVFQGIRLASQLVPAEVGGGLRFIQFVNVLQAVADCHFRRQFAGSVIGDDLFVVISAH